MMQIVKVLLLALFVVGITCGTSEETKEVCSEPDNDAVSEKIEKLREDFNAKVIAMDEQMTSLSESVKDRINVTVSKKLVALRKKIRHIQKLLTDKYAENVKELNDYIKKEVKGTVKGVRNDVYRMDEHLIELEKIQKKMKKQHNKDKQEMQKEIAALKASIESMKEASTQSETQTESA